jgi:hypothetical protein
LQSSIDDTRRADRAGAVLALVGVINCSDNLLLSSVVEHSASGRDIDGAQFQDGAVDAFRDVSSDGSVLDVLNRGSCSRACV